MFDQRKLQKVEAERSFDKCIDYLECSAPLNATVKAISSFRTEIDVQSRVSDAFVDLITSCESLFSKSNPRKFINTELIEILGNRNFIPLTKSVKQSSIAIALYAGDGIVAKITDNSYLTNELRPLKGISTTLPCVLPPIITRRVDNFFIEIFPWIDQSKISKNDVSQLSDHLQDMGLVFCKGDDRIDNVGRLSDGTLTVLDGNAVEIKCFDDKNTQKHFEDELTRRQMSWYQTLDKNFPEFYVASDEFKLHEHLSAFFNNPTDYSFKFPRKVKV